MTSFKSKKRNLKNLLFRLVFIETTEVLCKFLVELTHLIDIEHYSTSLRATGIGTENRIVGWDGTGCDSGRGRTSKDV